MSYFHMPPPSYQPTSSSFLHPPPFELPPLGIDNRPFQAHFPRYAPQPMPEWIKDPYYAPQGYERVYHGQHDPNFGYTGIVDQILNKQPLKGEDNDKEENEGKPLWRKYGEIVEFVDILKEMILYEIRCEALRLELAFQPDFRIPALYQYFSPQEEDNKDKSTLNQTLKKEFDKKDQSIFPKFGREKVHITTYDFTRGCRCFALDPDPFDVQLLLGRHKIPALVDKKVTMDYQEFFTLFYPLSKGNMFEWKLDNENVVDYFFCYTTMQLIERQLRLLLSQEDAYEFYRREIARREIDLDSVFKSINKAKDEVLTLAEMRFFLMDHGFSISKEELQQFFRRLDKHKNGKILKSEFIDEFTPRIKLEIEQKTDNKKLK